jgi:hypothetical protein
MIRPLSVLLVFIAASAVADQSSQDTSITVYSSAAPAGFDPQTFIAQQRNGYNQLWNPQGVPGFGVVKEIRELTLQQGLNEVRLTDVAEFIDPTTVSFKDLTDSGTAVLEQNFEFDLTNPQKLLEKYLDREIGLNITKGEGTELVKGTLLSAAQNQLVLRTGAGIQIVPRHSPQLMLGELPGGLITRPTLVWNLQSGKSGKHKVRTTYQTNGMTWRSDYNLVLDKDDKLADMSAWVTLMNLSGAAYKNTKLKLIAGDVQRVRPHMSLRRDQLAISITSEAGAAGFEEKPFFEYHMYTLPRRTDVKSNSTQQLTLFPTASGVKVEKKLVYYGLPQSQSWGYAPVPHMDRNLGTQSNTKVDVYIEFANKKENKMGMPLPAGKVRVFKADEADGTLEFIGEDVIDHTARDERVLVKIGQAFDVVGERKQVDFQENHASHEMTEMIEIVLKNHKEQAQKVVVRENLFRSVNWEITRNSDEFEKVDARTIHFPVTVPAHGEKKVRYTVRYTSQ